MFNGSPNSPFIYSDISNYSLDPRDPFNTLTNYYTISNESNYIEYIPTVCPGLQYGCLYTDLSSALMGCLFVIENFDKFYNPGVLRTIIIC